MTWTVGEIAQVTGIISVALTVLVRYVLRPQMRKGIEEAIATERGIVAVIREKLPELAEIVAMKEALNALTGELKRQHADTRGLVETFMLTIRAEMKVLTSRIDEEGHRNEEHRDRNVQHTKVLQTELDRLIQVVAMSAKTAAVSAATATVTAKTGESLASTVARDAERRREGDER